MDIRRLSHDDLPHLRQFWIENWGADFMVTRGKIYKPEQLSGFVVEENNKWLGLVTYVIEDHEMEITSLDSLSEGKGIGTELLDAAINEARQQNCKRLFLITTNDNLNALGFYQRRGWELVEIYRGAMNETRKIKPGISLIGYNNIPLRDEIELEMILNV
jgi:N-acetylglutamate synthase-like GNAT family acetyltransferase